MKLDGIRLDNENSNQNSPLHNANNGTSQNMPPTRPAPPRPSGPPGRPGAPPGRPVPPSNVPPPRPAPVIFPQQTSPGDGNLMVGGRPMPGPAAGSLFSSIKGGAGSFLKNLKDTSSKVMQTVQQ